MMIVGNSLMVFAMLSVSSLCTCVAARGTAKGHLGYFVSFRHRFVDDDDLSPSVRRVDRQRNVIPGVTHWHGSPLRERAHMTSANNPIFIPFPLTRAEIVLSLVCQVWCKGSVDFINTRGPVCVTVPYFRK